MQIPLKNPNTQERRWGVTLAGGVGTRLSPSCPRVTFPSSSCLTLSEAPKSENYINPSKRASVVGNVAAS